QEAALTGMQRSYADAQSAAIRAQGMIRTLGQDLDDTATMDALEKALASGDVEAALMAVQTWRVKLLDKQMDNHVQQLKKRNEEIAQLNKDLEAVQKQPDGDDGHKAWKQGEITRINGLLQTANNNTQLDMIGLQQVVNKRNEAFDTMTNLLGKFQKTL